MFTLKGKGQDADLGFTYRLVSQQQAGATGISVNGQLQVVQKASAVAALEAAIGTEFTITQLAAILEPPVVQPSSTAAQTPAPTA